MEVKTLRVIVDERERPSGVPDALKNLGVRIEFKMLEIGDYIVSPNCAVERKKDKDFLKSLYSGRLFDQASRIKEAYEKAVLVVEGEFPKFLYEMENPRVFWGALTTLAFKFNLNIFFSANHKQTADIIYTLAKHEVARKPKGPYVKKRVRGAEMEQLQLAIVASLPGIGPKLADRLLRRFGTVRRVFQASISEFASIDGVGRMKAMKVANFLDSHYKPVATKPRQLPLKPP